MEISKKQAALLILKQHGLLEKVARRDCLRLIGRICGVQAQAKWPSEIAMWNRVKDYAFDDLRRLLYEDKVLVKIWCMRGTQHIVPAMDIAVFLQGTSPEWLTASARALAQQGRWTREERLERIYPILERILRKGPLARRRVVEALRGAGIPAVELNAEGLAKEACYLAVAVPGPEDNRGTSSRGPTMTLLSTWLPKPTSPPAPPLEATAILLKRYFTSYGPASLADAAYFLGARMSRLRPAFQLIHQELRSIKVYEEPGAQWVAVESEKALDSLDDEVEPPLKFLGAFDQILLGFKEKTRFVPSRHLKQIYRPSGNMAHPILVQGKVAGVWSWKKHGREVEVISKLFESPDDTVKTRVRAEAEAMSTFLSSMADESERKPNG